MSERTLTVAEAAEATGVTPKALRRRIERGVLASLIGPDGKRRIPASALGLKGAPADNGRGVGPGPGAPLAATNGSNGTADLIERLERLARENGQLRQIEVVAGQDREALIQARARVVELEARLARRWWRRGRRWTG